MTLLALFAIAYRCVVTTSAHGREQTTVHHVVVSGSNMRVETETDPNEGITSDVLISNDGGKTRIAINTRNKTWFDVADMVQDLTKIPGLAPPQPKKIATSVDVASGTAKLTYVDGEMNVSYTLQAWTTDKLPAEAAFRPIQPRTNIPVVDAVWLPAIAKITAFPMKLESVHTRQYPGGKPVTATSTAVVDQIDTNAADPPAASFKVPEGYRRQLPQIGAPGGDRQSH